MINLLVVGAGSVGKRHMKNFADLGCLVSCVDPRSDRLQEAASMLPLQSSYLTLSEAWKSDEFEGAVICSPTAYHASQAMDCVRQSVPVLLEKPLSVDAATAQPLLHGATETNVPTLLGYTYRWWPPLVELRRRLLRGDIGIPLHARFVMGAHLADWHPWERYQEFFMAKQTEGGGALLDESHFLDLALWLFGTPSAVSARVERLSNLEIDTDDNVDATLIYESGLRITIHLDLYTRPHQKDLTIVGDQGTLFWSFEPNCLRQAAGTSAEWIVTEYTCERNLMFSRVAEEFLELLDGKRTDVTCSLADGYKVLQVIDAMRLSSDTEQTATMKEAA